MARARKKQMEAHLLMRLLHVTRLRALQEPQQQQDHQHDRHDGAESIPGVGVTALVA